MKIQINGLEIETPMYIRLTDKKIVESKEFETDGGLVILDFDSNSNVVGIEIV